MDSLTQIALGGAVGEATLGRRVGNRAAIWGMFCGTLPDLDMLVPLGDPVSDFTYHRSASHSFLVLALVTPLVVWLIMRFHPGTRAHRRGWALLVYLVLATHVLLDCFTVYGTQPFWPLGGAPIGFATIFIIDPLYTVPLLAGLLTAVFLRRTRRRAWAWNVLGLAVSTLYLAWSVGASYRVEAVARASLEREGVACERLLVTPAPFNTLLWRVLAMDGDGYHEGVYSFLDARAEVDFARYRHFPELLAGLEDHPPVWRLAWFTKGFYSVTRQGHAVVMTDLRMGMEPDYVFGFRVGTIGNPHARPSVPERVPGKVDWGRLPWLWERVWGRLRNSG